VTVIIKERGRGRAAGPDPSGEDIDHLKLIRLLAEAAGLTVWSDAEASLVVGDGCMTALSDLADLTPGEDVLLRSVAAVHHPAGSP
jgi:hypothetical protein